MSLHLQYLLLSVQFVVIPEILIGALNTKAVQSIFLSHLVLIVCIVANLSRASSLLHVDTIIH